MNFEMMKSLCCAKEDHLFNFLYEFLKKHGYSNVQKGKDYIVAEGTSKYPVCLLAHLDTVFLRTPDEDEFYYDSHKKVLWNPNGSGFDDRAGVYAIIVLILKGYTPSIIFTRGEERGGIGAGKLITRFPHCPFKNCKALIQLDRAGYNDMVFYSCGNDKFTDYIGTFGFEEDFGTFTDISIIAPQWGLAAVNLSIGYEYEHTAGELLHIDWCDETIEKVKNILDKSAQMKKYKYIAIPLDKLYSKYMFETEVDYQSECICCGKNISKGKGISLPEFAPYVMCNACYDEYYCNDDNI